MQVDLDSGHKTMVVCVCVRVRVCVRVCVCVRAFLLCFCVFLWAMLRAIKA